MQIPDENKIPRAVKNEWFYLFARVISVIGLPICAFLMLRIISSADAVADNVTKQGVALQILTTKMDIRLDNDQKNLADHELRLRGLERK